MPAADDEDGKQRRPAKAIGTVVGAVVLAAAAAVGTGIGTGILDRTKSDEKLITAAAEENLAECGTPFFLETSEVSKLASAPVERKGGWEAFRARHDAVVADHNAVEVSIQGESDRVVTLTDVSFTVKRERRPAGAVFSNPCGDDYSGRGMVVDLDKDPPRVIRSNADPQDTIGLFQSPEQKPAKPIRLPWTVSVTDPLLLTIVAKTRRCLCTWSASITWKSGDRSGKIAVDNDGQGFQIAGGAGTKRYLSTGPNSTWAVAGERD